MAKVAVCLVALALCDVRPSGAGAAPPRIVEAHPDLQSGLLEVQGEHLVGDGEDDVVVTLAREPLAVVSATATTIVANLPAGIAAGTYRLVVAHPGGSRSADEIDVTLGTAGPAGADGAPGVPGEEGEVGPTGVMGEKGDRGARGDVGVPGPPGLNRRGAWDATATYEKDDAVSYQGATWVAVRPNVAVAPAEGPDWSVVAANGPKGAAGATGPPGPAGPSVHPAQGCAQGQAIRGIDATGVVLCGGLVSPPP
jgi:hypothetical protein